MQISSWQLSSLVLGALFVGSLCAQGTVSSIAQAAPADVKGSPNIIADVYRNSAGTFIVCTDGTVFNAADPSRRDLGHPFRDAPSAAVFAEHRPVPSRPQGSPSIPVGAITRTDASYVVFSDGSVKLPADDKASAPGATPGRVLIWNSPVYNPIPDAWTVTEEQFTLTRDSPTVLTVHLKEPATGKRGATAALTGVANASVIVSLNLQGRFLDDKTITFTPQDYAGFDGSRFRLYSFSFTITAE